MADKIVLLSGHISSGKSTLARLLNERFGILHFRTRELLTKHVASEAEAGRRDLQDLGDDLDRRTSGEWVRDALGREIAENPDASIVVVDAVRIARQVEAIRSTFGSRVVHIHLTASREEIGRRFEQRARAAGRPGELRSLEEALQNETEQNVDRLRDIADAVINTERSTESDVLVRVASFLRLYGSSDARLVDVLVGGETGSEGKGNIAAILAREYDLLVRVGGPNAGHTVLPESGPAYTHHSLPCGTLTSTARLLIGAGAVVNVQTLMREIADCGVEVDRLSIDPQAMIISRADIDDETTLVRRIGSTGQGVGFATARRVRRDNDVQLARDIVDLAPFIRPAREVLEDVIRAGGKVFLEGTQGSGLSLYHGPYPYVTSRDTTASGCLAEVGIPPRLVRRVIMVCRTYPIRVQSPDRGTSGPMSRELSWEEIGRRSRQDPEELRKLELTSTTRRQRRVGEFDWDLLRRAAFLNGPTDIALTFVDYLDKQNKDALRFDQLAPATIEFIEEVERVAGAPVSLIATGFHRRGVIDRRRW